jgi:hypothetical protein
MYVWSNHIKGANFMSEHIKTLSNDANKCSSHCHSSEHNSCMCQHHHGDNTCNGTCHCHSNEPKASNVYESPFIKIANKCRRRLPQVGDVYTHFKGMKVYIVALAYHTETNECLVVYRHEDTIWARPLEMFLSEVDKSKYPNATQTYRLERELPWGIEDTIEFKNLVNEYSRISEFKLHTHKELVEHILKHMYL